MSLGPGEIIVILLIVAVLFGGSKLPQLGEGLGKAIRGFKNAVRGDDEIDVSPKKELDDQAKRKPDGSGPKNAG